MEKQTQMMVEHHQDRVGRGVAVYVKKNLSAKIISKSTELVEYINLEIGDSNTKTFFMYL